jgi:hypothetical protein
MMEGTRRTARIGVDLPVLIERPASSKHGDHCCDKGTDDEGKSNVNPNDVSPTESILKHVSRRVRVG